jgi:DNA-binding NtrC family response regulator
MDETGGEPARRADGTMDETNRTTSPGGGGPPSEGPASAGAPEKVRVLVVDDELGIRRSLERLLASKGFEVETAEGGEAALRKLGSWPADVVLVDLIMPGLGGMELLPRLKKSFPEAEVVIMTAHGSYDKAMAAVRAGARTFLTKPFQPPDVVPLTVGMAAEHKRLLARNRDLDERNRDLEKQLERSHAFGGLIGGGSSMREVYQRAARAARSDIPVLVLGESGTGKELVARAVHDQSDRSAKPFIPVNCSAIASELVESEFFGHVRGAFTGAHAAKTGLFEAANGGTLFLDEIGELPLSMQPKLLRVLQEGTVRRVGANDEISVNVRVIAATHRDLEARVAAGEFRGDLYYRLAVFPMKLPPLRERREDIPVLARHFMRKLAPRAGTGVRSISEQAMRRLCAFDWPGNVRQLENAIFRALVSAQGATLLPGDLPPPPFGPGPGSPGGGGEPGGAGAAAAVLDGDKIEGAEGLPMPEGWLNRTYAEAKNLVIRAFHEAYVNTLLQRTNGNVTKAALQAGLDRSNFRRLLKRPSSSDAEP